MGHIKLRYMLELLEKGIILNFMLILYFPYTSKYVTLSPECKF